MNNKPPTATPNAPARTPPAPGSAPRKPVHEVRMGFIKAAIWENTVGESVRYNVTLTRFYKDGEQWRTSESFGRDDLLIVAKVADRAHTWICDQRATN